MRVPTTQDALWRDVEKTLAGLPVQLPNVRALYDAIKDTTARHRERAGQLRDLIRRRSRKSALSGRRANRSQS